MLYWDFTMMVCNIILGFQDHHACYHSVQNTKITVQWYLS